MGFSLASTGMMENVIVYLIKEFNIKSIAAAQTSNILNGCTTLFPLLAAIIADSFLGSFTVASLSSLVSFLVIHSLCFLISCITIPITFRFNLICRAQCY